MLVDPMILKWQLQCLIGKVFLLGGCWNLEERDGRGGERKQFLGGAELEYFHSLILDYYTFNFIILIVFF
jgi:hypothetical protein